MAEEVSWDKIEIAFFIVAICLIVIAIVYFSGYQVPGFILLIFGIAAIIVGILKIISSINSIRKNKY
jgi:uncharacterized membrane protein HdeD (DUF308 family)